jgi:hypothetical protein
MNIEKIKREFNYSFVKLDKPDYLRTFIIARRALIDGFSFSEEQGNKESIFDNDRLNILQKRFETRRFLGNSDEIDIDSYVRLAKGLLVRFISCKNFNDLNSVLKINDFLIYIHVEQDDAGKQKIYSSVFREIEVIESLL